jgi:hypothetical protein
MDGVRGSLIFNSGGCLLGPREFYIQLQKMSTVVMCRARLGLGLSGLRLAKTQARPRAEGRAWLGLGRAQARACVPKQ